MSKVIKKRGVSAGRVINGKKGPLNQPVGLFSAIPIVCVL